MADDFLPKKWLEDRKIWYHTEMEIPAPIAEFFKLKNAQDDVGLGEMFTEDAVVVDGGEKKTMQGADAIKAWIAKSISNLNLQTEILRTEIQGEEWLVDTVMTGNFKASPARFKYSITLKGEKIARLEVNFLGSVK